jgi:hypothetical protein
VGAAAQQNKRREHPEHPVETKILPPPHKLDEQNGYDKVSKRNQPIGNGVQPQKVRTPEITHAVWHEIRIKQLQEKGNHDDLPFTSRNSQRPREAQGAVSVN